MLIRFIKRLFRRTLEQTNFGFRILLRLTYGVIGPYGHPDAPWTCAVLKFGEEVIETLDQIHRLGLPPMYNLQNNWDSLAALDLILRTKEKSSRIFDAGGERYSMILPWLSLYGYKNLTAGNLVFDNKFHRGTITYEYSDITRTKYSKGFF